MKIKTTPIAMIIATTLSLALFGALMESGKAEGHLTVAGKAVKLQYAYAKFEPGFVDPKTKDTVVILTDVPLNAKSLADKFARGELVKEGKLNMVEVVINAKQQPISVTIYHKDFGTPHSGGSTEDAFAAELFNAKAVAGRVYRKSPGENFEDIIFTYDARFHASIK